VLLLEVEPEPVEDWIAQEMQLQLVYEDADLLVINKPADLVVHPAAGHRQGTLVNGLLHYCPALESVPRAGIVHRLDKDTTGLLVVAKNLRSHNGLVQQLQARTISRQYQAVVQGVMTAGGTVSEPLGRHPVNRIKRAVVRNGQEAVTNYRVLKRFRAHTHIQVNLETGRTHQIRVHMAHLKYPIVGDPLYNSRLQVPSASSELLKQVLADFRRQALHAWKLSLMHPLSGKECNWESTLPSDFETLLKSLRDDRQVIES
jgi:23S rRNA pseudouridine1911/1915/1917 synthase